MPPLIKCRYLPELSTVLLVFLLVEIQSDRYVIATTKRLCCHSFFYSRYTNNRLTMLPKIIIKNYGWVSGRYPHCLEAVHQSSREDYSSMAASSSFSATMVPSSILSSFLSFSLSLSSLLFSTVERSFEPSCSS